MKLELQPVSWGDFYYTNESIRNYENKMKQVAERNNCDFIPVFADFICELNDGQDFLPDGLHPNDAGHEFMSQIILKKLSSLLAE